MPTLLAIQVSPRHQYSTSRKLSAVFVERWLAAHPGGKVIERDLMKTNPPFVDIGLLTRRKGTVILASGGDYSPGSRVEGYNLASGYLRQVLAYIGITDLELIMAGRARAGETGETAVEAFGEAVSVAAAA